MSLLYFRIGSTNYVLNFLPYFPYLHRIPMSKWSDIGSKSDEFICERHGYILGWGCFGFLRQWQRPCKPYRVKTMTGGKRKWGMTDRVIGPLHKIRSADPCSDGACSIR